MCEVDTSAPPKFSETVLRDIAGCYAACKKSYPHASECCIRELVRMVFQSDERGWVDIEDSDITAALCANET